MNQIQFPIHQNFFLLPKAWGECEHIDVVNLLDNVISNFYSNLDINLINRRQVFVAHSSLHSPPRDYPELITVNDTSYIFLMVENTLWCQYSYQFSHELCHYVIDTPFPPIIDKFGWFHEVVCELASIFTLKSTASTWQHSPPYSNWIPYSDSLNAYAENIIKTQENNIEITFDQWLSLNIETLYKNRINRHLNRIVAVHLLPIFLTYPFLWRAVQYLRLVDVTSEMDFKGFISEWKKHLPDSIVSIFSNVEIALIKNI